MRYQIIKGFVWRSTPESIAARAISVLAVAEIAGSVAGFWWLFTALDRLWPLWVGLFAAPLVLLRSETSVDRAVELWDRASAKRDFAWRSLKGLSILICAALAGLGTAWFLSANWLTDHSGFGLLWRGTVIGFLSINISIVVAIAVVGAVVGEGAGAAAGAATVTIAGVRTGLGVVAGLALGVWLHSLYVRLRSVVENLPAGARALPGNWRRAMFFEDAAHCPELLPGAGDGADFRTVGMVKILRSGRPIGRILAAIALLITLGPALLWRYSLKATFWLYWPLVFIEGQGKLKTAAERDLWTIKENTALEKFGLVLSLMVLFVAVLSAMRWLELTTLWATLTAGNAPLNPLALVFVLDWGALINQPWKILSHINALLAVGLFFWLDHLRKDRRAGKIYDMQGWPVGALVRAARLKLFVFCAYWVVAMACITRALYLGGYLDCLTPALSPMLGPPI